jgi:alkylation response protein AidB-like acyl-CoA dehydrogenase
MNRMNSERDLLRDTVAALVEKHASPEAVRVAMASERGYDETLWKLLCEQVGVAALVVPEELGGAGGELADAAVVLEELGKGWCRHHCSAPPCRAGTSFRRRTGRRGAGGRSRGARRSARWCSVPITWSTATSPTS